MRASKGAGCLILMGPTPTAPLPETCAGPHVLTRAGPSISARPVHAGVSAQACKHASETLTLADACRLTGGTPPARHAESRCQRTGAAARSYW